MIVTLDLPDETNAMTVTLVATSASYTNIETFGMDLQKYHSAKATLKWDKGFDVTISSEIKRGGDAEWESTSSTTPE